MLKQPLLWMLLSSCTHKYLSIISGDVIQNIGTIGPDAQFQYVIDIKGIKLGSYNIVVGLASDKVEHVSGEKEVSN